MSIASSYHPVLINFSKSLNDAWAEPTEQEKKIWEMQRTFAELKAKHEQFLRDREEKERRLLYAIAEKLGIDVDNI